MEEVAPLISEGSAVYRDHVQLNLGSLVSWVDVFPLIDEQWVLGLPNYILPKSFACPFCRGEATIYAEQHDGGEWIHCRSCNFAGDILEFAGGKLKLSPEDAVRHLTFKGLSLPCPGPLEPNLVSYRQHLARRQRCRDFWQAAVQRLQEDRSPELSGLLGAYLINHDVYSHGWPQRAGRFIGAASRTEVADLLWVNRTGHNWKTYLAFDARWQPMVLVLPLYDLPGHLSGFAFLGRRDHRPALLVRDLFSRNHHNVRNDPGLWMFDLLWQPSAPEFPAGELFITNDFFDALGLQIRHLRLSPQPLPLVVTPPWPSRTTTAWGLRRPLNPVFTTRRPDISFFDQARELEARVRVAKVSQASFRVYLCQVGTSGWLAKQAHSSRPWYEALAAQIKDWDTVQLEKFTGLFPEKSRNEFLSRLDQEKQAVVRQKLPKTVNIRTLNYLGWVIAETPHGWDARPQGKAPFPVMRARLRIEEVICNKLTHLKCRLTLADGRSLLCLIRDRAQRASMTQELIEQCRRQLQVDLPITPFWSSRIWEVAKTFSAPEITRGQRRVGWDRQRGRFTFPQFALLPSGDLATDYPGLVVGQRTPCRAWEPAQTLLPTEVTALGCPRADYTCFWGAAFFVLADLLAPLCGQPRRLVCLYGPGAALGLGRLDKALGLPGLRMLRNGEEIRRILRRHGVMTVVHNAELRECFADLTVFVHPRPLPAFVLVKPASGLLAYLKGAQLLRVPPLRGKLDLPSAAGPRLIIAYLRSALARGLPFSGQPSFVRALVKDVIQWWRAQGGNVRPLCKALRQMMIFGEISPWRTLVRLSTLCRDKALITPEADSAAGQAGHILVLTERLEQLLKPPRDWRINTSELFPQLVETEAWRGETSYQEQPAWAFDRELWEKERRLLR